MSNSFNDFFQVTEEIIKKANSRQGLPSHATAQTILEGESWNDYFGTKNPTHQIFAIKNQMNLLESIYDNQTEFTKFDSSLVTFAGIFLKGNYDPIMDTRKLTVMKENFLKALSDSQLITLKEAIRLAQQRLNQNDAVVIMKVLNKNRVLVDEILMGRVDPKTKLNGLLD